MGAETGVFGCDQRRDDRRHVLYSEQGDAPEAELDSPTLSQRLVVRIR